MVSTNFLTSIDHVLKHEGGFTQNKHDSAHKEKGSSTNLGVTSKSWASYTNKAAPVSVMKSLTKEIVTPFYKSEYWDKCKCSNLPSGIDYFLVDFAINAGVSKASKTLQKIIKVKEDGIIGIKTIEAVNKQEPLSLLKKLHGARQKHYNSLKKPTFIKGWTKRNDNCLLVSEAMISL